ncbi:MAG: hypothetical protein CMH55_05675 [Myxococcales bacterium]|nr:hypothetical protein [Myxococcales bacterium]
MSRIVLLLPFLACAPIQLYEGDRAAFDRMLDVMEPMEITTEDRHLPRPAPLISHTKAPVGPPVTSRPAVAPGPAAPPAGAPVPRPRPRQTPATAPGAGPSLDLTAPAAAPAPARRPRPETRSPTVPTPTKKREEKKAAPGPTPIPKTPKTKTPPLPKAPAPPAPPPTPAPKIPGAPKPPAAPDVPRPKIPAAEAPKREKPKRQLISRSPTKPKTEAGEASAWASADGLTSGTPEADSGEDVGLDDLFPPAPRPKGPRDPDGNRALIGKRKGPLSDCYVNERLRDEGAAGTIKLLIEVPETLPNKVSVMRSEFSKAMGACVSRALSDVPFPGDPAGKSYRFAIPFTFRR